MNEENGEISGVFKRVRRGDYGEHNKKILEEIEDKLKEILTCDIVRSAVIKEIGDRHWYTTRFLQEIGATWRQVEEANQSKLTKRKKKGVIMGHGDERENLIDGEGKEKQ